MAIRKDSFQWEGKSENLLNINNSSVRSIENEIIEFFKDAHHIPKERFAIARNQILSLYRRMRYHPEKKALCRVYRDQIIKIITLERGIEQ